MELGRVQALRLESHVIELRCQADEAGRAIECLRLAISDVERVLSTMDDDECSDMAPEPGVTPMKKE